MLERDVTNTMTEGSKSGRLQLQQLPSELLCRIFSHLTVKDKLEVSRVSRYLSAMMSPRTIQHRALT